MDCLGFQSLIGIQVVRRRGKQLTPVSADVFVSIPDRDFGSHRLGRVSLRLYMTVPHGKGQKPPSSPDIFDRLNNSIT